MTDIDTTDPWLIFLVGLGLGASVGALLAVVIILSIAGAG